MTHHCAACNQDFASKNSHKQHLKSKGHQQNVAPPEVATIKECIACRRTYNCQLSGSCTHCAKDEAIWMKKLLDMGFDTDTMLPNEEHRSKRSLCTDASCQTCFDRSLLSHPRCKYYLESNDWDPRQLMKGCRNFCLWGCPNCFYIWSVPCKDITSGRRWCPHCAKGGILCDDDDCKMCFARSFASHPKSQFWAQENKTTPRQVHLFSTKDEYVFNCGECKHQFDNTVCAVSQGHWCPYCTLKKLCGKLECGWCFDKSFAANPLSRFWSQQNSLLPHQVFANSHDSYLFNCPDCKHVLSLPPERLHDGHLPCGYCSTRAKLLCANPSCLHCFNRSFASHPQARFWSSKNVWKPRQCLKSSRDKRLFICDRCSDEFSIGLNEVVKGRWCKVCRFKTLHKLLSWLKTHLTLPLDLEATFDWCRNAKTKYLWRFDIYIAALKLIIELDGNHHFKQVWNWANHHDTQARDLLKMDLAARHGLSVIRLQQEFVLKTEDWQPLLTQALQQYETPTRVFIAENQDVYAHFLTASDTPSETPKS